MIFVPRSHFIHILKGEGATLKKTFNGILFKIKLDLHFIIGSKYAKVEQ